MATDKGITTLESLSGKKPSQSLRPEPQEKPRKIEERFGNVTNYRLMWTGRWMEGVVSDNDAHLPLEEREKMLIPRIVKAPFEAHINDKGDLKVYFDKGFVLFEDAPDNVKAAWEKAKKRNLRGASLSAPLDPEVWEKEQARKKAEKQTEEKAVEEKTGTPDETPPRNTTGQFTKKSNS